MKIREKLELAPRFAERGLYSPDTETAACGLGFVCNLSGTPSHSTIEKAIQILINLEHRGACGCDEATGDGAGILIQLPHRFLKDAAAESGIKIGDRGDYAAGLVFLPPDRAQRETCESWLAEIIADEGLQFLGWREVPTRPEFLGRSARDVQPVIRQIFVGRSSTGNLGSTAGKLDNFDDDTFERRLFVIRKRIENHVRSSDLPQRKFFYIPSLSHRTMIYKGLMIAPQICGFFPDLEDSRMEAAIAMVHQRYSTNTFPTWDLAHPFRYLCHNGEINTLRGNINWMNARQAIASSPKFANDMAKLLPLIAPGGSDSASLDNALEALVHTGRSMSHSVAMLIPEAWQLHETMSDQKRAFYEYHSTLMEPWDGPASIIFSDGREIGAVLDRNGLRPSRYTVTKDGLVILGSETGAIEIPQDQVASKGRLQPGRMLLCNIDEHRIVPDEEIKERLAARKPYRTWLRNNLIRLIDLPEGPETFVAQPETLTARQRAFGYTSEDLKLILQPMAVNGEEPLGSMGTDTPLAVLSQKSPTLFSYFKQLFAQVTNPPLDAIREELVTSTVTNLGCERNFFEETAAHCKQLRLEQPILIGREIAKIRSQHRFQIAEIDTTFVLGEGLESPEPEQQRSRLETALDRICSEAKHEVVSGAEILILSDAGLNSRRAAVPALLVCAAVHHHLIRAGLRSKVSLVIESGEPREVHHFSLLLAFGAAAIHPYLAFESICRLHSDGLIKPEYSTDKVTANYVKAINKGVVKVMSKMGISTIQSYRGAQICEAVGLSKELVQRYFTGTHSRLGGLGLAGLEAEAVARHRSGFPLRERRDFTPLESGGQYHWRRGGEAHLNEPLTIAKLQQAVRNGEIKTFKEYSNLINERSDKLCTLRGLLQFKPSSAPVPLSEVEPAKEIVKRFKTGAMSFGSISFEAHAALAIAMNRLGGKSNTGEGGEDPIRYEPFDKLETLAEKKRLNEIEKLSPQIAAAIEPGDSLRSAIKQVASGRFGVTSDYLVNASELQIKMAQGAKPGEGGQLPAHKVDEWIGKVRHSTPGVGLISPPPHHDIYSIEDLSQLIHDLKNANREARVSVKLVAEVGVGTVAAGVAKGKADTILISGHDGGTGASPLTSIKHTGLPWELGLAEAHQVLVLNDLRSRVRLEVDGQLKTGRDVAIACLLGAEEFGFSTAPLIATGCVMMRKCHLNTCPVGIATQDPELRKKFAGRPEHVVNFMFFVAEELREIMAQLGFRTINEMIGQSDRLDITAADRYWKSEGLDFTPILYKPEAPATVGRYYQKPQEHGLEKSFDLTTLLGLARPVLEETAGGGKVYARRKLINTYRTVGTIVGSEVTKRFGSKGLPEDSIHFKFDGSAGQSFGAFVPSGMTLEVEGDGNDYFGKGLSGGKLIIYPAHEATFAAEDNIILGNVALYGATSGEAYIRGIAGERFAVRNSGASAVVEGLGDHGCEYMTGGRVVVLGSTGRNFAAGMSGGIAYVLDSTGEFRDSRCNRQMVDLERLEDQDEIELLNQLVTNHLRYTGSAVAADLLPKWGLRVREFVKVIPLEYKKALEASRSAEAKVVQLRASNSRRG